MKLRQVRISWLAIALACCSFATVHTLRAQETAVAEGARETETGLPITDPLVRAKCGTCHQGDTDGNLSRLSWMRTTPEGWAQSIKRMVALNGLSITAEESRQVVRSLSASHGLAPEEAIAVAYIPEKRMLDETNIPNDAVRGACASCHAFGQPLSWRRSALEWERLQEFHVALYSQADAQYSRRAEGGSPAAGEDEDEGPTNGEVALEYMREAAPLHTPEWAAWSARQGQPRLAGDWLLTAAVPGQGRYVGTVTIAPGASAEEFVTTTTLRSLADGAVQTREGLGLVYASYAWRGRSQGPAAAGSVNDPASTTRETLHFAPDQQSAKGRWFWGEYHEFGYDVALTRATAAPAVLAVSPGAVKAGAQGVELTVWGHNLPPSPTAQDIGLGSGVALREVVSAEPGRLVLSVDVAADAASGPRDVAIAGAVLERAFPVYRQLDFLKVTPETGLGRLGGLRFAKGFQQFEAIGYEHGPDGKRDTADDIAIGPVAADWRMEEFMTVDYDDDTEFVGELSPAALFTPGVEGPNPERRFGRNNYGEVWVVATARDETGEDGTPLTGRAYLVVTVPSYQRWDQPAVSQ